MQDKPNADESFEEVEDLLETQKRSIRNNPAYQLDQESWKQIEAAASHRRDKQKKFSLFTLMQFSATFACGLIFGFVGLQYLNNPNLHSAITPEESNSGLVIGDYRIGENSGKESIRLGFNDRKTRSGSTSDGLQTNPQTNGNGIFDGHKKHDLLTLGIREIRKGTSRSAGGISTGKSYGAAFRGYSIEQRNDRAFEILITYCERLSPKELVDVLTILKIENPNKMLIEEQDHLLLLLYKYLQLFEFYEKDEPDRIDDGYDRFRTYLTRVGKISNTNLLSINRDSQ